MHAFEPFDARLIRRPLADNDSIGSSHDGQGDIPSPSYAAVLATAAAAPVGLATTFATSGRAPHQYGSIEQDKESDDSRRRKFDGDDSSNEPSDNSENDKKGTDRGSNRDAGSVRSTGSCDDTQRDSAALGRDGSNASRQSSGGNCGNIVIRQSSSSSSSGCVGGSPSIDGLSAADSTVQAIENPLFTGSRFDVLAALPPDTGELSTPVLVCLSQFRPLLNPHRVTC